MMLLISLAITVAFVASWATTLHLGGFDLDFWWELALLIVIMLLGALVGDAGARRRLKCS